MISLYYALVFFVLQRSMANIFLFFFQAEDGIRDATVTGVQTCALPILPNVGAISANLGAHATLFQQEQIDIAPYNFNFVETLKAKGVDVEFVVPDSGPVAWRTSMHIVKNAARPDLAFQYIEGAIAPEVQAEEAKPPYDVIPTHTKVAMTPVMQQRIARTPADLSKLIFQDWRKLNEGRSATIERFNREIK